MLSNLTKWSRVIPTFSSSVNRGIANNFSKVFLNLAPKTENYLFQTKSLFTQRNESFGLLKIKKAGPCLPHRGRSKFNSLKRRNFRRPKKFLLHTHAGLLKRIRIVN